MSIETELKLQIAPEDVNKLVQQPLLQSATLSQAPQRLYNTYFDTPEHNLFQQGVGLRVRRIGDKRVQTLKTAGHGLGGLHQRHEWEMEVTDDLPDYSKFPKAALPHWCTKKKNLEKIKPLFITDFMRTTWNLALDDGSQIEVALDQGEVKTSGASVPLSEVELELKSGSPDKLYQVALTLQESLPLRIENKSKAALGYALHQPQPLIHKKAGGVGLTPEMTAEQAFIHIISHGLGHLQANEDVVLFGEDIEGVHQMRVALRRWRSGLTLYQTLIPKKTYMELYQQLKWLTQLLGVARDWDVFALSLQQMQSLGGNSLLAPSHQEKIRQLQKTVIDYQTGAYITVREALRSSRYNRMLLLLGEWLIKRRWRDHLDSNRLQQLDAPAKVFATRILDEHYQSLCKQAKKLTQIKAEQRHKLRISLKKMAYGARFFADLYPHQATKLYINKLSGLQDKLGILNDAQVAINLLEQIQLKEHATVQHFLNGWYVHQQVTHLADLEAVWRAFLEQEIFWRTDQ